VISRRLEADTSRRLRRGGGGRRRSRLRRDDRGLHTQRARLVPVLRFA